MSESNSLVNFTHITVAGSGVLGYQIAVQAAFHGFKVVVYDINDEVLNKAKTKFANIAKRHQDDLGETSEQAKQAEQNLRYSSDLSAALKDADLLIEAVPEDVAIKKDFYQKASAAAPENPSRAMPPARPVNAFSLIGVPRMRSGKRSFSPRVAPLVPPLSR